MYSGKKEEIFVSAFIVATIIMLNSLNVCCKQQIISTFSSSFFFTLTLPSLLFFRIYFLYTYTFLPLLFSLLHNHQLYFLSEISSAYLGHGHTNGRGFRSRACVTHSGFVNLFFFFFYCPHIVRQISSVMVISRRLLSYISC